MIAELEFFVRFVVENLIQIWPYLLITIPIAVAVQFSGASKFIRHALSAKPMIAILLATAVGTFSPLCSCTVIPVVAALLIGGVPLAPVMAFWVASPSMDPEIFFLSVALIGWELAVWRLAATLVLSLGAGYITQFATTHQWLGDQILRERTQKNKVSISNESVANRILTPWQQAVAWMRQPFQSESRVVGNSGLTALVTYTGSTEQLVPETAVPLQQSSCSDGSFILPSDDEPTCQTTCETAVPFWQKLGKETWGSNLSCDSLCHAGFCIRGDHYPFCARSMDHKFTRSQQSIFHTVCGPSWSACVYK